MSAELQVAAESAGPPSFAVAGAQPLFVRRPRLDPGAPVVDNIARVIGAGPTTRLIAAFGGHRLYISHNPAPTDPVAMTVGYAAALRLGAIFGGERIWLPNGAGRENRLRIAQLRRRGVTVPRIAREIGCSERYVYKVLRQIRDETQA